MKIKEVHVEVRRTFEYQSYNVGLTATLDDNDNVDEVTRTLQNKAKDLVIEKMRSDFKKK